ncbi:MAG: hypothetical protein JWR01_2954 [Subtercola sp.]|nr:hypothetical protein [Subtercola sp.]
MMHCAAVRIRGPGQALSSTVEVWSAETMTIVGTRSESAPDQLASVKWRVVAGGIWIATALTGGRPVGIVSERRPGVFSVISATGADLGSRRLLVDALETLEDHLGSDLTAAA